MRLNRGQPVEGPLVRGFHGTGFRLDDVTAAAALLLTAEKARDWAPPPLAELDLASVEPALDPHPEFLILGTGARLAKHKGSDSINPPCVHARTRAHTHTHPRTHAQPRSHGLQAHTHVDRIHAC